MDIPDGGIGLEGLGRNVGSLPGGHVFHVRGILNSISVKKQGPGGRRAGTVNDIVTLGFEIKDVDIEHDINEGDAFEDFDENSVEYLQFELQKSRESEKKLNKRLFLFKKGAQLKFSELKQKDKIIESKDLELIFKQEESDKLNLKIEQQKLLIKSKDQQLKQYKEENAKLTSEINGFKEQYPVLESLDSLDESKLGDIENKLVQYSANNQISSILNIWKVYTAALSDSEKQMTQMGKLYKEELNKLTKKINRMREEIKEDAEMIDYHSHYSQRQANDSTRHSQNLQSRPFYEQSDVESSSRDPSPGVGRNSNLNRTNSTSQMNSYRYGISTRNNVESRAPSLQLNSLTPRARKS